MNARNTYTVDGSGRRFTRHGLELYRAALCAELRRLGRNDRASSYETMTLAAFAAQGGYSICRTK